MKYQELDVPVLSVGQTDQAFYHSRGFYSLIDDTGTEIIPVNRSYVRREDGDRHCPDNNGHYVKDEKEHYKIDAGLELLRDERVIQATQKALLFRNAEGITWVSSESHDARESDLARMVIDRLEDRLVTKPMPYEWHTGLFGSHRVHLNGNTSDIDLMLWSEEAHGEDLLMHTRESLLELGYTDVNQTEKLYKYAERYAKRMGIIREAGIYLANQRHRFISPEGTHTSLQRMPTNPQHEPVRKYWEEFALDARPEFTTIEVGVKSEYSNALPKVWELEDEQGPLSAVSFAWGHQGLGTGTDNEFHAQGLLLQNEDQRLLFLRDHEHYILPKRLT